MGSAKINLVLTDPPYGVGIDYGEFDDTEEAVAVLIDRIMPLLLKWPVVLLTSGHRCMWLYPRPTWVLGWVHPAGNGRGPWGFNCLNPILAYGKDPALSAGKGSLPDTIVLAASREGVDGHPVIKPVEVWKWIMERGSIRAGDKILDPFMGSGTTLVCCELLGRIAYGIELNPVYVDVAIMRWHAQSGRPAVRESDGELFPMETGA